MSDWETVGEKPYSEEEPPKAPLYMDLTKDTVVSGLSTFTFNPMAGRSMGKSMLAGFIAGLEKFDDLIHHMPASMPKMSFPKLRTMGVGKPLFYLVDDLSLIQLTRGHNEAPKSWVNSRGLDKPAKKKANNPRGNPVYGTSWRDRK